MLFFIGSASCVNPGLALFINHNKGGLLSIWKLDWGSMVV